MTTERTTPVRRAPAGRRRGRPPGGSNTREDVLAAARRVFAERGYEGATLRAIAAQAGVDPAMVRHFFGDKGGLFRAALHLPFDPAPALAGVVAGGIDGLGERLVRFFLSVWEGGAGPSPFVAFLRGAADHEESRTMLHDLLTHTLFPVLSSTLKGPGKGGPGKGGPDKSGPDKSGPDKSTARSTDGSRDKSTDASPTGGPNEDPNEDPDEDTEALLRVVLCGSQIVGLGMARYVVRVEPLASMPVERLVALYAPTLQRYLTGELPTGGP
jgi:AcrR family transcriptional regulator